jgi:hypothetical protein
VKRPAYVDALVRRVGDVDPGPHGCARELNCEWPCRVCDIVDELADALVEFERAEFFGTGSDLVDVEPIAP